MRTCIVPCACSPVLARKFVPEAWRAHDLPVMTGWRSRADSGVQIRRLPQADNATQPQAVATTNARKQRTRSRASSNLASSHKTCMPNYTLSRLVPRWNAFASHHAWPPPSIERGSRLLASDDPIHHLPGRLLPLLIPGPIELSGSWQRRRSRSGGGGRSWW
jgi:hypothetical protein